MPSNIQIRPEGPAYDEMGDDKLNLNSFAAIAVCGLVAEAHEQLSAAGVPVTAQSLSKMSDVLAGIVLRAQYEVTGQLSFQRGANTRLRGMLRSILGHRPAPFGRPAAEWEQWISRVERFLSVALIEAMQLHERRPVQNDSHLFFAADVAAN